MYYHRKPLDTSKPNPSKKTPVMLLDELETRQQMLDAITIKTIEIRGNLIELQAIRNATQQRVQTLIKKLNIQL